MRLVNPYRFSIQQPAGNTDSYVELAGAGSGQYLTTPDTSKLQILGDLSLITRVRLADWTPAASTVFIGKAGVGTTNRSYQSGINTAGRGQFVFSNGTSTITQTASLAPTGNTLFSDDNTGWFACTIDIDDGLGNYVTRWFIAPDQKEIPTTWTLVPGGTLTTPGAMNRSPSTQNVGVGGTSAGGSLVAGRIYRALITNDIGPSGEPGTNYQASMNPADWSAGNSWFSPLTGETWSILGGASVILAP